MRLIKGLMLITLRIISRQVTWETTEVLCADTVVEAKVRAVNTGLSVGAWVPEGISFVIQSVAGECSGYPRLSLHLQSIYHVSGITVPPPPYNEQPLPRLLTMNTSCFSGTQFTFLLCVLRCMYVVCGCMYHSRCNLYNLLLECGSWGSNRFSAKHLYPLNHLNSPSSSSNYDHCSFTCPAFLNMV